MTSPAAVRAANALSRRRKVACCELNDLEAGNPDDHLQHSRRLGILGFGWVGLLGSLYVVLGFGIDLLVER
jgi:hypothetical protein